MKARKISIPELCKAFDCTPHELKEQYKRDTQLLRELKATAKEERRPIRGYTIAHLNARVEMFRATVNRIGRK